MLYSPIFVEKPLPHISPAAQSERPVGGVLIIDNYDSFTYNIRGALAKLGIDAVVVRNDDEKFGMTEIEELDPSHIIIGPGPGTPNNPDDIGITDEVIAYAVSHNKALLGICLGHQAIVKHFGGEIVQAEQVKHGKTSQIDISEGGALFKEVDADEPVMRYHSLIAADADSFPDALHITSRTRDDAQTIMSVEHEELPIAGVQFHPESFATPEGQKLLENFLQMSPEAHDALRKQGVRAPEDHAQDVPLPGPLSELVETTDQHAFEYVPFPCSLRPEQVYERLHAVSDNCYCFESLDANGGERVGRYSYFGLEPEFVLSACNNEFYLDDDQIDIGDLSAFDALNATVEQMRALSETGDNVPDDLRLTGGFVGGMSYEAIQYRESKVHAVTPPKEKTFSYGYYSDGLVYDNQEKRFFYYTRGANRMQMFEEVLRCDLPERSTKVSQIYDGVSEQEFRKRVRAIRDEKIRTGESFQTVLSRKRTFGIEGSMAPLYLQMREECASGNMHAIKMGDFESVGSFPELTLKVSGGEATTYQVAGTRPRTGDEQTDADMFQELITDPKELAEHMMLIDLAHSTFSAQAAITSLNLTVLSGIKRLPHAPHAMEQMYRSLFLLPLFTLRERVFTRQTAKRSRKSP